jgi:hypothetical protein
MITSTFRHFYPLERNGIHSTEGWVAFRAGLDGFRPQNSPARGESLYCLSDPGPAADLLQKCISTLIYWQSVLNTIPVDEKVELKTKYQARQLMYVERNIDHRSRNRCCSGKTIIITYCEFMFVALVIQHAMRKRHIVICGLPLYNIFFTFS